MNIGVVGINHKIAHLALRESLSRSCQKYFALADACVLLSTCNRTEIYFSTDNLSDTHSQILHLLREDTDEDFEQKLYSFFGSDCFHHLCRVTCGLDSAVLAETEIQGQVKTAYEAAAKLPSVMHFAFQKALHVGKMVRKNLVIPSSAPSLEQVIATKGEEHFLGQTPSLLFVGASHINGKVFEYLKKRGFEKGTITSRNSVHTENWGKTYSATILDWKMKNNWPNYDWIIFGTRSQTPLLFKRDIQDEKRRLIIDLSVPRNVDPALANPLVTLFNIDQLNASLRSREETISDLLKQGEAETSTYARSLATRYTARETNNSLLALSI